MLFSICVYMKIYRFFVLNILLISEHNDGMRICKDTTYYTVNGQFPTERHRFVQLYFYGTYSADGRFLCSKVTLFSVSFNTNNHEYILENACSTVYKWLKNSTNLTTQIQIIKIYEHIQNDTVDETEIPKWNMTHLL